MQRSLAVVAALVVLMSAVFGGVGAAGPGAGDASGPAGMDAVDDRDVGAFTPDQRDRERGPPGDVGAPRDQTPTTAQAWEVHSSDHAADLEVDVASTPATEVALVLRDEQNHDGREVAVDAATLEEVLDERPDRAYGLHESGDRWTSEIRYEDGFAIFEVPRFSENTVTFEATFRIDADPSVDGDTFTYSVDNDSVDNFTIDLIGSRSSQWVNRSWSGNHTTETYTVDVGGSTAPEGPAAGDPELRLTGIAQTRKDDNSKSFGGGTKAQYTFSDPPDTLTQVSWRIEETDAGGSYNVSVITDGTKTEIYSSGSMMGNEEETVEQSVDIDTGTDVTIEFDQTESSSDFWVYWNALEGNAPRNVTATADDGTEVAFGNLTAGGTTTKSFPISENATSVSFTATDHGPVDVALDREEQTETIDPVVTLNGQTVASYSGTLAEGVTKTYTPDPALVEQNNSVGVSVSEAADGPTGEVGMNYSHTAVEERSVGYEGETFSERYSVSKTWDEEQSDATLEVEWASNRVIEVRDLRVDYYDSTGNHQSTTSSPTYTHENSTLTIELGDIPEGWTTEIEAVGSKIQVNNGSVRVLNPTTEGNTLDTEIEVLETGDDFHIDVGGTERDHWVHYTVDESWTGATTFAEVSSSGAQSVHADPPNGSTFRLRSIPVEIDPETTAVNVEVTDPDQPEFRISKGDSSDDIAITYNDTISGEEYRLVDKSNDIIVDTDVAESPVSFLTDGSATTYLIEIGGDTSTDDPVPVGVDSGADLGPLTILTVLIGVSGSLIGFVYAGRRLDVGVGETTLLGVGGSILGLLGAELLTTTSLLAIAGKSLGAGLAADGVSTVLWGVLILVTLWLAQTRVSLPNWMLLITFGLVTAWMIEGITGGAIGAAIEEVGPLLLLVAVGGVLYILYQMFKPRPINLGGSR